MLPDGDRDPLLWLDWRKVIQYTNGDAKGRGPCISPSSDPTNRQSS